MKFQFIVTCRREFGCARGGAGVVGFACANFQEVCCGREKNHDHPGRSITHFSVNDEPFRRLLEVQRLISCGAPREVVAETVGALVAAREELRRR